MRCVLIFFLITAIVVIGSEASFYDAVPLVSQLKLVILYMLDYKSDAQKVYANFQNMTHLFESIKSIDESIPIYGHIKALITEIRGDHEAALFAFEAAHRSTCVIIGSFLLIPPIGGTVGLAIADSTATVIERKPVGVYDHAFRFDNKTGSEHIDMILDITLAASSTSDIKLKIDTEVTQPRRFSVTLRMKEIGHADLVRDQTSFTSRLISYSSKTLIQPYTPMDHARKNDTIKYLLDKKYGRVG